MIEEWKVISEPYQKYEISNMGNCRSLKTKKNFKQTPKAGYIKYSLMINSTDKKELFAHRLVAAMFCEGQQKGLVVNHLDGNKLNNKALNLEWDTVKNNNIHRYKISTKDNRYFTRNKVVEQKDRFGNLLNSFKSVHEAERETGIAASTISNCCLGKVNLAGGFVWNHALQPDLPKEIWEDFTYNEKKLKISNMGRLIVANNIKTFGSKHASGYLNTKVNNKTFCVHRLVAEVFCDKPSDYDEKFVVDHINRKRDDNRAENLRWVSIGENNDKANNKTIKITKVSTGESLIFKSLKAAAVHLSMKKTGSLSQAASGKRKTCRGHYVEYVSNTTHPSNLEGET